MDLKSLAEMVKELRESSGASLLECKKALLRCGGDMEQALVSLREQGNPSSPV